MAGVQAGSAFQVSIDFVAKMVSLQQDMERLKRTVRNATDDVGRSARAANDNLAAIGKGAGAGLQQFSREVAQLKARMDPAWASLQTYRQQVALLRTALAEGALTHKQFVDEMRRAVSSYQNAGRDIANSSNAMRAGFQNVGFQLSDFFVQVGGGTSAIRAAAQQMPQLTQAVAMMGAGADGAKGKFAAFAGFMGGPWGAAITVGISLLGALATKFLDTGESADKADKSIKDLSQQFNFATITATELSEVNKLLADSNAEIQRTAIGAANATRLKAEADRFAAQMTLVLAEAELARLEAFSNDPTFAEGNLAYGGMMERTQGRIDGLRKTIGGLSQVVNKSTFDVQVLTAGLDEQGRKAEALRTQINNLRESYQRTGNSQFLEDAIRLQGQLNEVEKASERTRKARKAALTDEEKAIKQANEATQSFIESLQDEIARIGLNEKAIRQLEVAKAREVAVTEEQRKKIDELNDARERAIEQQQLLARIKEADDASAKLREETAAIERQTKAIGLQGWERERFLLLLQREAELRPLLTKLAQAQTLSTDAEAQAIQREIDALNEKYRASVKAGNLSEVFRQEQEEARALDDALRDIIGSLQQIGGFGGVLGGLLGILTGNTSAIRGPIGDLLNIGVDIDPLTKQVRKLGDVLKDAIGGLGSKMVGALQAAGTGIMAGAAAFGQQGMGGMIASGAGGILGSIGGSMLSGTISSAIGGALGSAIGSAVPVIGTILGGLAGGLIGKLFGGTKRGSAIISGGDVSGFYGNSGKMKDQAGEIAGSLLDTLQQIADQFGTTLDAQAMGKISIGVRDGKYAVDTLGRGYTKSSIAGVKSFGTDADAAVEYALKTLLDRGAIAMREGSMKIIDEVIKAGGKLQEGLTRALQFEQIMNELEGGNSQLVTQVRAIRSQFQQYISVMKQAGASVQDLTRVQEMQVQRINQLIAQAGDSYRSTFYTDSQNVAFAQQQIHAVLDPLGKGAIDTVAEYMAAVEAAQKDTSEAGLAWLETLYGLSDEFGVLKAAAEAAAAAAAAAKAQKEAEAAAAAAERERQAQERQRAIEAAQDVLRQAFEREAGELQETIDKFDQLGKSLREFRDSLTETASSTANAARLLAKFKEIGRMAALGDAEAMGNLAGAGKDYLAAAKARASSFEEYQRAVALVRRTTEAAIGAADAGKSVAEEQLDQLKAQVGQLIDLNAGVVSVQKAIQELLKLTGGSNPANPTNPNPSPAPGGSTNNPGQSGLGRLADWLADREARLEERRQEMEDRRTEKEAEEAAKRKDAEERRAALQQEALDRAARATERTYRLLERLSPNGTALATEPAA